MGEVVEEQEEQGEKRSLCRSKRRGGLWQLILCMYLWRSKSEAGEPLTAVARITGEGSRRIGRHRVGRDKYIINEHTEGSFSLTIPPFPVTSMADEDWTMHAEDDDPDYEDIPEDELEDEDDEYGYYEDDDEEVDIEGEIQDTLEEAELNGGESNLRQVLAGERGAQLSAALPTHVVQ